METHAHQAADLLGLGEHCSFSECQQIDFLPFTCDCCKKVFCLDHRLHASHSCPLADSKQPQVIVCPLCSKGVHLARGEDANVAFERHSRSDCNPANYGRKKPRCPVQGCKDKLDAVNTYTCKVCGQKVCLKHRLEQDHSCPGPAQRPGLLSALQRMRLPQSQQQQPQQPRHQQHQRQQQQAQAQQRAPPGQAVGSAASSLFSSLADHASAAAASASRAMASAGRGGDAQGGMEDNSVRGTAERRRQMLALPEVCPVCSARFPSVAELIAHSDSAHSSSDPVAGAGSSGAYACHRCGVRFADPVQLVAHNERCANQSGASCVLC